jgi:hypothetical protein
MAAKSLIEGIASDAAAPIGQVGEQLLVKATLLALFLASSVVAAIFLTAALYSAMEELMGELGTLLGIGGLYLAVAIGFAVATYLSGRSSEEAASHAATHAGQRDEKRRPAPPAATRPLETADSDRTASEPRQSETGRAVERLAVPVLDLLREQGMERERLALAAGVTAAKELQPWMLVGLMMVVGVVIGHFTRRL